MVKVNNISYAYNRKAGNVLNDVSFTMEQGESLAILGNNGAGKSTLLKCIDKIYPANGGTVYVDDVDVFKLTGSELAQNIAFVPQNVDPINMTVFDAVLLGRKPYIKWDATREDRQIASDIIHQMGLDEFILRNVSELSGGEAQKVTLARALAQEPKLLLLDEPTSNLDPYNQHEVMQTVRNIARQHNICVMIVIHDLNLAVRYCDKFLFLKDTTIYSHGGHECITAETIEDVYGIHVHIIDHMNVPVIVPFPDA